MLGEAWPAVLASDWSPGLAENGLDLWSIALAASQSEASRCEVLLDQQERDRAARFVRACDRRRYIIAHGALRRLLGGYIGMPACAIRYVLGPQGKPRLAGEAASNVSFNLSHSGDLALVAVARQAAIGIDVEQIRRIDDAASIARSFFAPGERAALEATPAEESDLAFLRCWTRKEALVKAIGTGLSLPLDDFEVEISRASAALLKPGRDAAFSRPWTMIALEPREGYVGAVAMAGEAGDIARRHFAPRG